MAPPTPPTARRPIRWWWWARAIVLVLGVPVVMAAIAAVLLIGREVTAPSWIVRDVEARAAEVLAGGQLGFGTMRVTVGRDLHPRLVMENAVMRDADGAVLARVPRIEGLISPRGVIQGRVLPQEIHLRGAQISLRRDKDGTVALAFEEGAEAIGAADGFLGLLEQADTVFEAGTLEALEQVDATGLIVNFVDGRAGKSWVVDDGRLSLDLRGGQTQLRGNVALLSGRSYVTNAELTYASPRGSRAADIGLSITDAAAVDIASQSSVLSWLGVLDAPISGAVRGRLNEEGALTGVSATLQIAAGQLRPSAATRPIPFDQARTYLSYDPVRDRLDFDLIEIDSDWGRVVGTAQTYLREYEAGLPRALLGQVQLSQMTLAPEGIYDVPLDFTNGSVDLRLRLDPFTLDVGQAVLVHGETPVRMKGAVIAQSDGWSVAVDVAVDEITAAPLLDLWPDTLVPKTQDWVAQNVSQGRFRDVGLAFRSQPGAPVVSSIGAEFSQGMVRILPDVPAIENASGRLSLVDRRFAVALDGGGMTAPQGGRIDFAGSTLVVPVTGPVRPPARFDLELAGRVTAIMSVLAQEPFNVLRGSDLPVSFAQGRAAVSLAVETPLGRGVAPQDRVWSAVAQVRDVRSEALLPGQVMSASNLQVQVDQSRLLVQGQARVGQTGGRITFVRALGPGADGAARLDADITLNQDFLNTFNIALPPGMVTGEGAARLAVDLATPKASQFRLTSDLRGIGLSLAGLGWSKVPNAAGSLTIAGQLGETPVIEELSLDAPGLQTTGSVTLAAGGGLARAAFERVQLGGWLDAPVVLVGRGAGRPAGIQLVGGSLDLRTANFGGGDGTTGPIEIALDRLQITDSMALTEFRGAFTSPGGLEGSFTGLLNGQVELQGTLVPVDGRTAVRIQSADAGAMFRASGLLRNAFGGQLDLMLIPAGAEGSYDGTLDAGDLRVRDAPALASLLDAVSVVGLLTQLDGQGLLFTDVDAQFRLTPDQVIVTRSSAIGPGLGLSLDGIYSSEARVMDFQGVLSPFYLINSVGSVLTRPGEGLIGFNFNLRGSVDSPRVSVNPLSALTPGMFREIFRRPASSLDQ